MRFLFLKSHKILEEVILGYLKQFGIAIQEAPAHARIGNRRHTDEYRLPKTHAGVHDRLLSLTRLNQSEAENTFYAVLEYSELVKHCTNCYWISFNKTPRKGSGT